MKTCALCFKELKFGNTPLFGAGKLKDSGVLCTKCYSKTTKLIGSTTTSLKKYSLSDIKKLLEENIQNKKNKESGCLYNFLFLLGSLSLLFWTLPIIVIIILIIRSCA